MSVLILCVQVPLQGQEAAVWEHGAVVLWVPRKHPPVVRNGVHHHSISDGVLAGRGLDPPPEPCGRHLVPFQDVSRESGRERHTSAPRFKLVGAHST